MRTDEAAEPARVGEERRFLLAPDDGHGDDRRARQQRDAREAVAERRQLVTIAKAALVSARALGEREHRGAGAEKVDAARGPAVDGADALGALPERRQLHQAMVGHRTHDARRLGLEETRSQDARAVERERMRAVVRDQHHAPGRQLLDAVALGAKPPAVEPAGRPVDARGGGDVERERLRRVAFEREGPSDPLRRVGFAPTLRAARRGQDDGGGTGSACGRLPRGRWRHSSTISWPA